ncbi:MAG: CoB--CoM heterodisulfide reductase iron-sulfur subunit A family protein [Chloroflexi bacterium]|nr:CoB--CoM heterodisulfide reductase iron-sulfur subunit A family protein [Chloroflexota bacterium]
MTEAEVRKDELFFLPDEISQRVLVVGGGIAGIQASLDIANMGNEVVLLEREPSLGGRMARLSAMYPNLDHPVCLLREMMVQLWKHPKVTLLTNSRIDSLDGFAGCFEAHVTSRARRVGESTCTGCGKCWRACPVKVESEFDLGLGRRTAIYLPYQQAIPSVPVIDERSCLRLRGKACSACVEACPFDSIDFEQPDSQFEGTFGAVVLATGLDTVDPALSPQYGHGRYADVITSLQLERMLASAGPTKGEVFRPSDGSRPESVVFVCCVGSRDLSIGRPYCSKVCCPNVAKQVIQVKRSYGRVQTTVFYRDIVAGGKGIEELVLAAQEGGANYIHGRVVDIVPAEKRLLVRAESITSGRSEEALADLVVLAVGLESYPDSVLLAGNLGAMCDEHGFIMEAQRQLQPVDTSALGVFVAGSASGPKDIGETSAQGSAVAIRVVCFLRDLASRSVAEDRFDLPSAGIDRSLL